METNKKIIPYIFLMLFTCIIFTVFYGRWGDFFFDISRELYVPSAINNGDVLYKDIFNVYAPLGYQLNAFITSIFGNGLCTFYLSGLINSILIIYAIYSISRIFLNRRVSISLCCFIITACFFTNSIANYILPYSYSVVYAMSTFLWALFFILYYEKTKKKKYLYLSFLIFGTSISFKYDYMAFMLILAFFFFYKTTLKDKLLCIISFFFAPFLSLTDLLIKGLNISDIENAVNYIILLAKSDSVNHLYNYLGLIPNIYYVKTLFFNLIYAGISFSLILLPVFFRNLYKKTTKVVRFLCNSINLLFFIFIFIILTLFYLQKGHLIFCWSSLLLFVLLVLFINKKRLNYDSNDKLCLILLISVILAGIKCIFNISFNTYGNFYLPFIALCYVVYICRYINNDEIKQQIIQKNLSYCLLIFALIYFVCNFINAFLYKTDELKSNKGTFYTDRNYSYVINSVCDYLIKNTTKEDKVLVVPDGSMINYFTDRKSDNMYYYLTPPNVEIFGSENIINALKANLPEYIVIQPVMYVDYGQTSFCKSYGSNICDFIYKNYKQEYYIQDKESLFWMSIYKNFEHIN